MSEEQRMDNEQRWKAKRQGIDLMQAGRSWQEAANAASVQISRSTGIVNLVTELNTMLK